MFVFGRFMFVKRCKKRYTNGYMDNGKKLTVCVVIHNSIRYLPGLLKSIEGSSFKGFDLLFVDNGSTDGSVPYLEQDPLPKRIIKLPFNQGHSRASNIAIKECCTRYLVLLDHDTMVDVDLFGNLLRCAEERSGSDDAVFAPKIIDKGRDETYYGGEFHFIGKTITYTVDPGKREVGMIGSTAPLIDLSKIPDEVRFDEDLFIYWNDADFFYRLRAAGRKIRFVPESCVTHFGGTSGYSHRGGKVYSHIRAFYVFRNHRLFILKSYQWSTILLFLPCFMVYELYNVAFSLLKRVFIKGYLRSWISTLRLAPGMLMKRRELGKVRKVGDKKLVEWYKLDYNPGVVVGGVEKFFLGLLDGFLRVYYRFIKAVFWR